MLFSRIQLVQQQLPTAGNQRSRERLRRLQRRLAPLLHLLLLAQLTRRQHQTLPPNNNYHYHHQTLRHLLPTVQAAILLQVLPAPAHGEAARPRHDRRAAERERRGPLQL